MTNIPTGGTGSSDPGISGIPPQVEDTIHFGQYSTADQNVFEYNLELTNFRDNMGGVFSQGHLAGDYSGASMPQEMRDFFAQNGLTLPQNPSNLSKDEHQQLIGELRTSLQGFKEQFESSGFAPEIGQKMLQAQNMLEAAGNLGEYSNINLSDDTLTYMAMHKLDIPNEGQGLTAAQFQQVKDTVGEHMNGVFNDMKTDLLERDPQTHAKLEGMMDLRSQLHGMQSDSPVTLTDNIRSQIESLGIDIPRDSSTLSPAEFQHVMNKLTDNVHEVVQRESFKTGFNENMVFSLIMETLSRQNQE